MNEETEVAKPWTVEDWRQLKKIEFECDLHCFEQLVALMDVFGHGLKRPVWSDYEISAETAEGVK